MNAALHTTRSTALPLRKVSLDTEFQNADAYLSRHLTAQDILEANEIAARRNISDKHIAEALAMVQQNLQDRIEAGEFSAEVVGALEALFERVDEVACECSAVDLRGAQ